MQYSFVTVASALVATVSASAISTIPDGQPQAPTYSAAAPTTTPAPVYSSAPAKDETTTEVVTHLTTVCPVGTHTYGSHTITATSATTVTISDCYCTVSKALPTAPASSSPAPVVPTATPASVSQISDNQPQAPTSAPSAPASSAPASSASVVSQISDNQPQAPTSAPAASAPAASVPAASAPAASVPAASAPVVSQISDNQPQAPTSAPAASGPAASAPAASAPAASAPAASPTPSPIFTAGASNVAASGFSFAAVLAAIAYVL